MLVQCTQGKIYLRGYVTLLFSRSLRLKHGPKPMHLAEFIRIEMEPILQDWESFAKTLQHANLLNKAGLRDHAKNMLLAIADDLDTDQSEAEQLAKSKGLESDIGETWAEVHGSDRHGLGFTIVETVSEFRALRASVVSHWSKSHRTRKTENEKRKILKILPVSMNLLIKPLLNL